MEGMGEKEGKWFISCCHHSITSQAQCKHSPHKKGVNANLHQPSPLAIHGTGAQNRTGDTKIFRIQLAEI